MPSKEIEDYFLLVEDRWVSSTEEEQASKSFLQDMAAEFLRVLKEAEGKYAKAHGRLSEVFRKLDDTKRAEQEWKTALQQDPYELVAWRTRLLLALAPYAGHLEFKKGAGFQGGVVGLVGRDLVNQAYEHKVEMEFRKLVEAYHQLANQGNDTEAWIELSKMMLDMADLLYQNDLVKHKGSWPNLYAEIAGAPWDKITDEKYKESVTDIRHKAEGRLLLYPPHGPSRLSTPTTKTSIATQQTEDAIPEEIRGLCWGGFLLNVFWGVGNRVWIALLTIIPYIGWIVPFILLFKGNEWAWRARTWNSVEHFKKTQKNWTVAALSIYGLFLLLYFIIILSGAR